MSIMLSKRIFLKIIKGFFAFSRLNKLIIHTEFATVYAEIRNY